MKPFVIPSQFKAIDEFSRPIGKMSKALESLGKSGDAASAKLERAFRNTGKRMTEFGLKAAAVGGAIVLPLGYAVKKAMDFEDRLVDVGKTTNMAGKELQDFGKFLREINTRTSFEDLLVIGEIGGRLGVAKEELKDFVVYGNQFAVALAKDYSGGVEEAITQVAKLKNVFRELKDIPIATAITKAGSVINELGASGLGTSQNLNDFLLRLGALPDKFKPSIQNAAALGAVLEKAGINAEVGASGLTKFFLDATTNIAGFSQQMKLGRKEALDLFKTDPTGFLLRFSKSLENADPEQLALKLKELGIGTQESIKVLGVLATNTQLLGKAQDIANTSFDKGISLQQEAQKKEATRLAQLEKMKKRFEDLAITFGEKMLPALEKLLLAVAPIVQKLADFVEAHPDLTKNVLLAAGAIGGLSFVFGGLATAVGGVLTTLPILMEIFAVAFGPIGQIVAGVILLYKGIKTVNDHWNEWGKTFTYYLGPLGTVWRTIKLVYDNWNLVTEAFTKDGILGALKEIGKMLLVSILDPIEAIVSTIADITGAEWAVRAADNIRKFQNALVPQKGTWQNDAVKVAPDFLVNPKAQQAAMMERVVTQNNNTRQTVDINVNDPGKNAKVGPAPVGVPIVLTQNTGKFGRR